MSKTDRLHALIALLQDGKTHRAEDLAVRFGVSERTLYRDMARLQAAGAPIQGTPGGGYRATAETTLPPLNLTGAELEALTLGLAVIEDAGDETQKAAAVSLLAKLQSALAEAPGRAIDSPLRPSSQLQRVLAQTRQAISARQKLRVSLRGQTHVVRPLRLDFFGRIWQLIAWDEYTDSFAVLPLADIGFVAVLPGLFVDEPGKTLADYLRS